MSLKATIKFFNETNQAEKNIGDFVNIAVNKAVLVMERNIKVNTPVVHGTLKRSIKGVMTGFGQGEVTNSSTEGGADTNYAIFVEYGTRYFAPRGMFRKGVAQSMDRIKELFGEEAKNVKVKVSAV